MVTMSKMTSHCAGIVQMREESQSGIRKWEEMWFKTTAEDGERGDSSDMQKYYEIRAINSDKAISPYILSG